MTIVASLTVRVIMAVVTTIAVIVVVGVVVKVLVLADVSANAFAVVMTLLEFPVTTPLGEFSRSAALDCRPLALLDCARVLQTRIP